MADGRNRQVLMGNDTLCMTGITDRGRHREKKRSLLTLLSLVRKATCTAPAVHLRVTALPCKTSCKSLQEPWKIPVLQQGWMDPSRAVSVSHQTWKQW